MYLDSVAFQLRKIGMCDAERLNEILGEIAAIELRRRRVLVAIDTTEVPYFGTRDEWVHYSPAKKCYVHRYVVAAAIDGSRKIPLSIRPISMFDSRARRRGGGAS